MSLGPMELLLIVIAVLIVFGAGKLPKVMGDMGRGIKNFKKGLNEPEEVKVITKEDKPENHV